MIKTLYRHVKNPILHTFFQDVKFLNIWENAANKYFYAFFGSKRVWEGFSYKNTVAAIKPGPFSLLCQNTPSMGIETKMDDSILFSMKSSYIFW